MPSYFLCPISQVNTCRKWVDDGHDTSTMTNLRLENNELIPNLYFVLPFRNGSSSGIMQNMYALFKPRDYR
uniref:Uncharacterized protein n=1 Tax=Arundo donax TaxID=35708 RepID=A0A0A8YZY3_ARUDO